MNRKYIKVDNKLVHQVSSNDVLICNGHVGIPAVISKTMFQDDLVNKLNGNELECFKQLYHEVDRINDSEGILRESSYILKSIVIEIPKEKIKNIPTGINNILNKYYYDGGDKFIFSSYFIDENSERLLLNALGENYDTTQDDKKLILSDFFRINHRLLKSKIYYATMFNDMKHSHFYKKKHEHVPGIMIIETVRQALYAYAYTFKCTQGKVSISIITLNNNFYHYVQSNYPLNIMLEDNPMPGDNPNRDLRLRAKLFQRNRLVGEFYFLGSIIKIDVFKKLRVMGRDEEDFTFYPVLDNCSNLFLCSQNTSTIYKTQLIEISLKGMRLFLPRKMDFVNEENFNFILDVNNQNIISKCQIESINESKDGIDLYAKYTNLTKDNFAEISEYIKHYTYVNDTGLII